jgi:hypothetical protein
LDEYGVDIAARDMEADEDHRDSGRRQATVTGPIGANMSEQVSPSEFLLISRGQWDKDLAPEEIQKAIDQFYVWLARLVDEGKMKTGQ